MAYSILAPSSLLERKSLFVIENERKIFSDDASRCKNVRFKSLFSGNGPKPGNHFIIHRGMTDGSFATKLTPTHT